MRAGAHSLTFDFLRTLSYPPPVDIERIATALVGAAFASRVLSKHLPLYARVGYGLIGAHLLIPTGSPVFGQPALGRGPESADEQPGGKVLKFEPRKARTIGERVAYIHEQATGENGVRSPEVYKLARSALSKRCGADWCTKERDADAETDAMFHIVKARVRYTFDPTSYDAFQTPEATLDLHTGDCDDADALLAALLMSIGYRVRSRVVHTKGFSDWNHIYLQVALPDGHWKTLDPTVNHPPGWEVPKHLFVRPPMDFEIPTN